MTRQRTDSKQTFNFDSHHQQNCVQSEACNKKRRQIVAGAIATGLLFFTVLAVLFFFPVLHKVSFPRATGTFFPAGMLLIGSVIALALQQKEKQRLRRLLRVETTARLSLESRLAAILEAVDEGVFVTDTRGCVLFVNAAAESLTGWSAATAQGRPLHEVCVLVDSRTELTVDNLGEQVPGNYKKMGWLSCTVLVAKNKEHCRVAHSVAPIVANNGQTVGNVLVVRDISDIHGLHEKISKGQHILNLFIEHTPAAIAILDQQMRYLAVTRRYLVDYQLGERDLTGLSHYEVFPEIPARWRAVHQRCLQGAVEQSKEDVFVRQDGAEEWNRWEIHPWYTSPAEVGGIIIFSEVITDRKKMEKTLRQSEIKYRSVFENHTAAKLLIDPQDGRILEANQAAAAFYGWSREQLRSMSIVEINTLPPREVCARIRRSLHNKQHHFSFQHRCADSSVRDVRVYSGVVDILGQRLLHSIVHDVSDFRELEEQLRQVQKTESIGLLAGGVAHEFNNMLTVIIGYGQHALERITSDNPLFADLQHILQAAEHSAKITGQLLTFARQHPISPRVFDLNGAIRDLLNMLEKVVGMHIHLKWQPCSVPVSVIMDPPQLDQILVNLCLNARESIDQTGTITITTDMAHTVDPRVEGIPAEIPAGDYVLLSVHDTGCGMEQGVQKKIFDPFFTTKENRTGLGLPVVHGIVHQNRGHLEVESSSGGGTTISVYLPLTQPAMDEKEASSSPTIDSATILLVEGDPSVLDMTRSMLIELGYQVLAASSMDEALQLAGQHGWTVDLLLTDRAIPQLSGPESARRLQNSRPSLPVLFMSGSVDPSVYREGACGLQDVLTKPFTMDDLARAVEEALASSPHLSVC